MNLRALPDAKETVFELLACPNPDICDRLADETRSRYFGLGA